MKPIPIEKLFPGASVTLEEGGFVNKEELIANFTKDKATADTSIVTIREQIARLKTEEERLIEVRLRLEGCLHAMEQLDDSQPVSEIVSVPDEKSKQEEH